MDRDHTSGKSTAERLASVLVMLALAAFAFWSLQRFYQQGRHGANPPLLSWALAGIAVFLLVGLAVQAIGRGRWWSDTKVGGVTMALSALGLATAIAWVGAQGEGTEGTTAPQAGGSTAVTTTSVAAPATTTPPPTTTTTQAGVRRDLVSAVEEGLVQVDFRALGGASGDIVELLIESLTDVDLEITVPPGLMLHNPAGGEQDLVVAGLEGLMTGPNTYEPADEISLDGDSPLEYLLEAYCAEAHEANPSEGGVLTMGAVAGADLVAVLRAAAAEGAAGEVMLVQAVVWVITDDVAAGDLEDVGYGLDAGEITLARAIIVAAGLDPADYRLFTG